MELELERKLIVLENSVKDIDERLAELYRETASLSLQKNSFLQDLGRRAVASKRRVDDVKRIHSELKTGLGDVSEKLARMDSVITQLDSMRKSARREKSKEFAELAESVLALNKRVSLLGRTVEGLRSGEPVELAPVMSRLSRLEKELQSKPADAFKRPLEELKSAVARLEKSGANVPSEMASLRGEIAGLKGGLASIDDKTRSLAQLEKQLKGLQGSVAALSGFKGVPSIDVSRVDEVEKTVEDVRGRANTVLKEIYDMVDGLKAAHGALDRKVAALSAGGDVDVSGMLSSIEELRGSVSNLSKGIEISRVIAEEVKKTQVGLSAVESWKSRTEELPRELERLAERLAALESSRSAAKDGTDLNNLKLAVAELANKNRLINDLALENQKLQGRLFVLEERLGPSERKEGGKDS